LAGLLHQIKLLASEKIIEETEGIAFLERIVLGVGLVMYLCELEQWLESVIQCLPNLLFGTLRFVTDRCQPV
jgi:hypothetical protein